MNRNIFKVVRAIVFGIALYLLLMYSPIIFLKINGINIAQPQAQMEDEPIYKDRNGKIITIHEYNEMMAYEKAEKDGLTSHAECKEEYPNSNEGFQRKGCHNYIISQKNFPNKIKQDDWASGKSTAQCEKEVRDYWEPIIKDFEERGEEFTSDINYDLSECENYDNARISKHVFEPKTRLDDIIRKLQKGESPTAEDNDTIAKDRILVSDYPENNHTIAYFNQLDYFFKLAAKNVDKTE